MGQKFHYFYLGRPIKIDKRMDNKRLNFLQDVLKNMPNDWLNLTTHRLDIYDESKAKYQFLDQFEELFQSNDASTQSLAALPTAYDYIRLGHPLSSILEWAIGHLCGVKPEQVISFSSQTTPILAVLRKNALANKATQLCICGPLPKGFDAAIIKAHYGYQFEMSTVGSAAEVPPFEGSTVFVSTQKEFDKLPVEEQIDFYVNLYNPLGSVLVVNGASNTDYISEIQHVRRRETISMTPANSFEALQILTHQSSNASVAQQNRAANKVKVLEEIKKITHTNADPSVGSSGLSVQYAIMMGLVHHANEQHPGKEIKFLVPPNCYGGTNDQARRVAACLEHVEVLDLPVDRENDMVQSTEQVLNRVADEDAVPFIIVEVPTNPRVEVPDRLGLEAVLSKKRKTSSGADAVPPVFILDQTFCPNVNFLGDNMTLHKVQTIAYVSGSKFPSGGKCTAGYAVANTKAQHLLKKIEQHLQLCDNEATDLQYALLAEQLPSMLKRIADAYTNTRSFVKHIQEKLPTAKINFVSEELAQEGFTPSVFSLDLPTKGETHEARETYKRALNNKLIGMMIAQIPEESKYCVSYGQLKGCYWTIPATSTQGTTKEDDKDYIARVSLSPNLDLEQHKKVFSDFVDQLE